MNKKKSLALKGGSYSLITTLIVLLILIAVNVLSATLPATWTKLDMSSSQLYSITGNTKVIVNSLEEDVTIYWIVQADEEDDIIENLLAKYESLSDHIAVVKKNPDIYPTFAEKYTDETVANNSLVVESAKRFRYIAYDDIYLSEQSMYSYTYTTSFDGEGAITSAIDYVVTDDLPIIYQLEGHGESELPETFSDQLAKENIDVATLSLLKVDDIPDDCAALMIYAPESDISEGELDMLLQYIEDGGKLLVMAGPVEEDELTNLYTVLSEYGVTKSEGILVEGDRDHYAFQRPYILLPDMYDTAITNSLIEENYAPIIPISSGLTVNSSAAGVTSLLYTSSDCFSKIKGYDLDTYEKEEGDIDGPFTVAVMIDTDADGKVIWFATSSFLEDMYNAYSSGANTDLAMNAVSALVGEREAIAIRSKSLNYNYLTITESQGTTLKATMIVILPLAFLIIGIFVFAYTRRKQNEAE